MNYTEELHWILDKPGTTIHNQDDHFRENIAFVHSLGLKCDCVGWSKLDLANPSVDAIFEKISAFCKENGWLARCIYTRRYTETESDWFELAPSFFSNDSLNKSIETVTETAEKIYTCQIRAFREMIPGPKKWGKELFVPERFWKFCLQNRWDDLDFCWVKDLGKYEAEQYFHIYGKKLVPHMGIAEKPEPAVLQKMDGWLPRISEVFDTLQQIVLPDCYLAADLPQGGIASACFYQTCHSPQRETVPGLPIPPTYRELRRNTILIHKDTAKALLDGKVLSARDLRPALVVDALPIGYTLTQTQLVDRPHLSFMEQMNEAYEAHRLVQRPVRMVSEKEALKRLRLAKKERKEDFQKAIPKAKAQELSSSDYGPVMPYYLIANGGSLSDAYELLNHTHAVTQNEQFHRQLAAEELLEEKPEGVVIAKCPDGDAVLLCKNATVIRFSHEMPEVINQWQSLAQFIVDAINDQ